MERLTYFDDHIGNYILIGQNATVTQHYDTAFDGEKVVYGNAIDKLAAYEDTGMTPEEISDLVVNYNFARGGYERYHEAEADGRLIVLPCKVGGYLYAPTRNFVSKFKVTQIDVSASDYMFVEWILCDGITGKFRIDGIAACEIGKTVFLTREEAEAALAAMEGREDG